MKRESAREHAKHPHYCSCGKVVHGNGAKAAHRAAHERRGDRDRYVTHDAWLGLATGSRATVEAFHAAR
jgi:hypothetical protein